jgi:hypothetical protein
VIAKAEWTQDEANPRFIVTTLKRSEAGARQLAAPMVEKTAACARQAAHSTA